MRAHLCTDADNTLWDTNLVFAEAQLSMLADIEAATGLRSPEAEDRGLAFLRQIDQRIAASHPERLRYPPALLAKGLSLALEGCDPDQAAKQALLDRGPVNPQVKDILHHFGERLRRIPPLRPRVREGLEGAAAVHVPVTVVTEERPERCRQLLDAHDLEMLVQDVVSIHKNTAEYRKLRMNFSEPRALMVGDQMDRDIDAARRAGFETFFFPSEFVPYWNAAAQSVEHYRISHYDDILPFLVST